MKKCLGFTLAEVLITLGIIGVIAALTTPALVKDNSSSKVGPSLAKFVNTFENAAQSMFIEQSYSTMMSIGDTSKSIGDALMRYMKIMPNDKTYEIRNYRGNSVVNFVDVCNNRRVNRYDTSDGMTMYVCNLGEAAPPEGADYPNIPSNQAIGCVFVDINGSSKPNMVAKDVFMFGLYNDGTLAPMGGRYMLRTTNDEHDLWDYKDNCTENGINNDWTCAGSIFENNMKVIYQ